MNKKKILLSATLIAVAGVISFAASTADKVYVRHNGNVISISENAMDAHLKHGDEEVFLYRGEWLTLAEIIEGLYGNEDF